MTDEVKEGDHIALIQDTIYNFGPDYDEEYGQAQMLATHLYRLNIIDDEPEDFVEHGVSFATLMDMDSDGYLPVHQAVLGMIDEDNFFEMSSVGDLFKADPASSKQLQKLVKRLNLDGVKYHGEVYIDSDETSHEYTEYVDRDDILKPLAAKPFYHGTNIRNAMGILKKGIRTGNASNWGKIKHADKVFLTTRRDYAGEHAVISSKTIQDSIIIELQVPDVSNLVMDYDVAMHYLGKDHEEVKRLGYDKMNVSRFFNEKYRDENPNVIKRLRKISQLNSAYGIYGYLGNIHPSHIKAVYTTRQAMENFMVSQDFGDDIEYGSTSVADMNRYTVKEFFEILKDVEQLVMPEFDDEEDY